MAFLLTLHGNLSILLTSLSPPHFLPLSLFLVSQELPVGLSIIAVDAYAKRKEEMERNAALSKKDKDSKRDDPARPRYSLHMSTLSPKMSRQSTRDSIVTPSRGVSTKNEMNPLFHPISPSDPPAEYLYPFTVFRVSVSVREGRERERVRANGLLHARREGSFGLVVGAEGSYSLPFLFLRHVKVPVLSLSLSLTI